MSNFYDNIEKKYNNLYSYGGKVERSFWKNIGDIVNKKAIFEQNKTAFEEIVETTEKIMRGNYGRR